MSVLKYDTENGELQQLPYHISSNSFAGDYYICSENSLLNITHKLIFHHLILHFLFSLKVKFYKKVIPIANPLVVKFR